MKEYFCKKINGSIIIDGNFDKQVWNGIKGVSLADTMTGAEPKQKTDVKMAWNNEFLYLVYRCEDKNIHATMTNYNDQIYWEDVVEVFIDDDSDLKTYLEIEVNPLNTLLHYGCQNDLKGGVLLFARVNKKIETAVIRDDLHNLWSAEIAIPFSEIVTAPNIPPLPGDRWRGNFYRIERPANGEEEFTAWSPTIVRRYHTPAQFGEFVFVE